MQALMNKTVAELVTERPARARVMERYGIDYCCGGKRPLSEAVAKRGVDAERVVADLEAVDAGPARDERDWTAAPLAELIEHIVSTHHAYLRQELPRLSPMVDKVRRVHGERHGELVECQAVFEGLRAELQSHMMKEEQNFFPMVAQMEAAQSVEGGHCGSVSNPIRQMEHEHDTAGSALERLRTLTGDYGPPADACNTYRAMLDSLAELEADLHQHIHKENNILFPRAAELEATLSGEREQVRG